MEFVLVHIQLEFSNREVAQGKEKKEPKEVSTSLCAEHVHFK